MSAATERGDRERDQRDLVDLINSAILAWIALGPPWVQEIGDPEPQPEHQRG